MHISNGGNKMMVKISVKHNFVNLDIAITRKIETRKKYLIT